MKNKLDGSLLFYIIVFIWTWSFYFAIIIFGLDPYKGVGMALLICGGCSPTFIGILMAMLTYQRAQRFEYLKRIYGSI